MEETKKPRRRLPSGRTVKRCLCVIIAAAVLFKIVDAFVLWNSYYERYYEGLITMCSIDEKKALDPVSRWGYAPYVFSDGSRKCTLAFTKPSMGSYNMGIQLDNTGFFDNNADESYTEPIYYGGSSYNYEVKATLYRGGRVVYKGYIYIGGDEFSGGEPCGFTIKEHGVFDYHYGESEEEKKTAEKLRPEIMKIKDELQSEIVEKL